MNKRVVCEVAASNALQVIVSICLNFLSLSMVLLFLAFQSQIAFLDLLCFNPHQFEKLIVVGNEVFVL